MAEQASVFEYDDGIPISTNGYDQLRNKIAGVLLGAAVADALGWPTEFAKTRDQAEKLLRTQEVTDFMPWEKRTGGRFNTYIDYIQPGEYSDDTQLTLCTARCVRSDGSFDVQRFSKTELPLWLEYARGAGGTITRGAQAIGRKEASWDNNFFAFESRGRPSTYTDAGANGAAMRIAPHPLANCYDEQIALHGIWRNAVVTHGHPRALWGALVYGKVLIALLKWKDGSLETFLEMLRSFANQLRVEDLTADMGSWLDRWQERTNRPFFDVFDETRREVVEAVDLLQGARNRPLGQIYRALGCFAPSTKGSGTGTVAVALAVFLSYGGNYEKAVLKAVNMFGSDTDTIAAMVGSMIGALHGQEAVPDRWANQIQDYGYFMRTAEAMTRIALREAATNDLIVDGEREKAERDDRDVVLLARGRQVYTGQRVTHPIFGLGWVQDVNSQYIRRKGGGTILLARVAFDIGQSCVFRSYSPAHASSPAV